MPATKKNNTTPHVLLSKWGLGSFILVLLIGVIAWLDRIKDRWYVFDPSHLHQLAQAAVAASPDDLGQMIQHIVTNLTLTYPSTDVALNVDSSEWMFNNAGGAMGAMYLIHVSLTEYLLIFGTPLGTEGHSGVHPAEDYFHVLIGEEWVFSPGQLEKTRFTPGTVNFMPRGVVRQYKMHEGCFALEYARGWIPLMTPFGFADTLSSTLDVPTLYKTVKVTLREMGRNLLIGKI
ncbi:ERG2/sigma1 receptor-like protein [Mycena vitilis]|nr:ERG2/sigma1 receptor-like protein [Mycena vitilis]